jgi:hypothetical protein
LEQEVQDVSVKIGEVHSKHLFGGSRARAGYHTIMGRRLLLDNIQLVYSIVPTLSILDKMWLFVVVHENWQIAPLQGRVHSLALPLSSEL